MVFQVKLNISKQNTNPKSDSEIMYISITIVDMNLLQELFYFTNSFCLA